MTERDSGTPFENTARVLRARLNRVERAVLGVLTDAVRMRDGRVTAWPTLSIPELCARTDYGVSSVQRALKRLEDKRLVRRFVRPGRTYLFQPLVNQLPLAMADAAQQPRLPDVGSEHAGAVDLDAHPASIWAKRGTQGRFVPVGDFHNPGTKYRSSPVENSAPPLDFVDGGSVQSTDPIGTLYRGDRYRVPIPDAATSISTDIDTNNESAARTRAGLPFMGVPMTAEQRRKAAREPAADGNYSALFGLALLLGRDQVEARKYLAVPIAEEGDLRAATKSAAGQSSIRYDLHTDDGDRVLHEACAVAWKVLQREGRYTRTAADWRELRAARRRRHV